MANEVVKKESSVPAVSTPDVGTEVLLASDMVIPRVLLMQALSEFVCEAKATVGQIVRSTTIEVLGDKNTPVPFIPLTFRTRWMIETVGRGGKLEFAGFEDRNAINENAPWDFEVDGQQMKRTKMVEVFALLEKDLAAAKEPTLGSDGLPSLDSVLMPVLLTFRSTGFKAGTRIIDTFMKVRKLREKFPSLMAYNYGLLLGCKEEENDRGRFFVFDVQSGKNTDPKFLDDCSYWYDLLTRHGQSVKTDDSSLNEGHDAAPASDAAGRF